MKKIYLMTLLAGASVFAQPVINPSNVTLNVASEVFFSATDGLDMGTAGSNKTWDFSAITLIPVGTSTTVAPTGLPGATFFPATNFCSASTGDVPGSYVYFSYDAQKMELLGEVYVGVGTVNYNANPKTYLEFPYTYNKVINDTYKASLDPVATAFTTTYDAYGKLILPFGTYNNVVRQKIVENGQTNYVWFHVSPFFPIIQTSMEDGAMGVMKNADVLASQQFHEDSTFTVFPNPTSGAFKIDMAHFEGAAISIYDILGKLIASEKANGSLTQIDISGCSAGVYFVKVTASGNQTSIRKIIKK